MARNHEARPEQWKRWKARAMAILFLPALSVTAACDLEPPKDRTATNDTTRSTGVVRAQPVASTETTRTPDTQQEVTDAIDRREVTFEEAEQVFHGGDYEEAAKLFEAYRERKPANPWGSYMLGLSMWRDDQLEGAETALRHTLELDGTHSKAMLNLARVLLAQGKTTEALDVGLEFVQLRPDMGEGQRVLGNIYAENGKSNAAMKAYQKAIVLDPEDAWAMNNLGLLRIQQGEYEAALGPLARATEIRPEQPTFQNNLGIALERSGYEQVAAGAFLAALDANPDHDKARTSLQRVEGRLSAEMTSDPIELSILTKTFTDEIADWKTDSGTVEADSGTAGADHTPEEDDRSATIPSGGADDE